MQVYVLPHLNLLSIHQLDLVTTPHEHLARHNQYVARIRKGDSLTYFSGSFEATGNPNILLVTKFGVMLDALTLRDLGDHCAVMISSRARPKWF